MTNDTLAITKRYFVLSNQADLTTIKTMMHPKATYSSANTGLYYGVNDIMVMMTAYFESHQSLNWSIESITTLTENIAEIHFICDSTDTSGKKGQRSGVERIVVDGGLIKHIEVR